MEKHHFKNTDWKIQIDDVNSVYWVIQMMNNIVF